MNIAICYWGMTRSTKKVYNSHYKYVFDILKEHNINYDIYMHTWHTDQNIIFNNISNTPIDYEEYKLLNPTKYTIENQSDFLNSIDFSQYFYKEVFEKYGENRQNGEWIPMLIRNHLCALESQKRVTAMCMNSNKPYDFIIYLRPDVEISNHLPIDIFKTIKPNDIAIPNEDHWEGYNDRFAIIPYNMCKYYAYRIDEIIDFRKNQGRIVSEKYAKFIIDKYFEQVHFIDFHFEIIR